MPLTTPTHPAAVFRQWQELKPADLPPGREAREMRAAQKLARRTDVELRATTKARAILVQAGLHKFKYELTHNRFSEMLAVGKALKSAVHSLRISLRAQNLKSGTRTLPSRAVQWQNAKLPVYALAWAHTLDVSLQEIGVNPGPLIVMWNMQCHVAPVSLMTRSNERNRAEMLRRDRALIAAGSQGTSQALRQAQARKQLDFHQGLLLDEVAARSEAAPGHPSAIGDTHNYQHITDAVGRLRAVVLTYQHPSTPLPPHPEQYTVAGGTWASNRRHWRQAMRDWLNNVDEAYPPAYEQTDRALPTYRIPDASAPPYSRRIRALTGPWVLWPKRFLLRSLTL